MGMKLMLARARVAHVPLDQVALEAERYGEQRGALPMSFVRLDARLQAQVPKLIEGLDAPRADACRAGMERARAGLRRSRCPACKEAARTIAAASSPAEAERRAERYLTGLMDFTASEQRNIGLVALRVRELASLLPGGPTLPWLFALGDRRMAALPDAIAQARMLRAVALAQQSAAMNAANFQNNPYY